VVSGRGLCDELITHPEESYLLWCVVVCDPETSRMRRPWPSGGGGCCAKKSFVRITIVQFPLQVFIFMDVQIVYKSIIYILAYIQHNGDISTENFRGGSEP